MTPISLITFFSKIFENHLVQNCGSKEFKILEHLLEWLSIEFCKFNFLWHILLFPVINIYMKSVCIFCDIKYTIIYWTIVHF